MNSGQESISTIMDNLNSLSENSNNSNLSDEDINNSNISSKTCTVDDIVNKRLNSLEDYVNSRVINIYQRPWNKLEQKLKLKKLEEYYTNGDNMLDSSEEDESSSKKKKKYVEAYSNFTYDEIKQFMNTSEKRRLKVDYNDSDCIINSILVSN